MRIDVGGAELEVEVSGPRRAPAVLCWNGAATTLRMWDHVRELLSGQFRFVCVDVRGTGKSSVSDPDDDAQFTFETYSEDANAVLDRLGIEQTLSWAMAWGSRAALVHAALHPGRVERVALFDLSIEPADVEAQKAGRLVALEREAAAGVERFAKPAGLGDHDDAELVRRALQATTKADLRPLLDALTMPVLLATGDCDPNLRSTREVAGLVRNARLEVMENVAHGSVLQRPDLATRLFADFAI